MSIPANSHHAVKGGIVRIDPSTPALDDSPNSLSRSAGQLAGAIRRGPKP